MEKVERNNSDVDFNDIITENDSITEKLDTEISALVEQVLSESWENLTSDLDSWQIEQLRKVGRKKAGITCLLNSWFANQTEDFPDGQYCNTVWDNVYCWPAAQVGTTVNRTCQETFFETQPAYAVDAIGNAWRICQENGTWLWGNWTDYSECATSYEEYLRISKEEKELVNTAQLILFTGSMFSLACLITAVSIFAYFRCLWCDRVKILVNLKMALILRYALLSIITQPFSSGRSMNYKSVDFVCKTVLTTYLYSTVASITWMFVQGIYIHAKLTTNIFDKQMPFKIYYMVGWFLPILILACYVVIMEIRHPIKCWRGYSEMEEMWIVMGPMIVALIINSLFLINILRILMTTVQSRTNTVSSDAAQIRKAAKATLFLFPLLGINNLLFVYNPGGNLHKYYVICNSLLGSTHGIFVAVVYCFLSKDVMDAVRRAFRRFKVRRSASRIGRRCRNISRSVAEGQNVSVVVIREHRNNFPDNNLPINQVDG